MCRTTTPDGTLTPIRHPPFVRGDRPVDREVRATDGKVGRARCGSDEDLVSAFRRGERIDRETRDTWNTQWYTIVWSHSVSECEKGSTRFPKPNAGWCTRFSNLNTHAAGWCTYLLDVRMPPSTAHVNCPLFRTDACGMPKPPYTESCSWTQYRIVTRPPDGPPVHDIE